jgi:hypothetical protein
MAKTAAPEWAAYNAKMDAQFMERDKDPVDLPERTPVAERILALWVDTAT